MTIEKCLLQIKVLRLLLLFGAFSSIVVLIIFSFPTGDQTTVSTFDSVFLDAWPIRASLSGHSTAHAVRQKSSLLGGLHTRRLIGYREHQAIVHDKIKRITMHAARSDEYALTRNASAELAKQNIRNIHIFYTFPVQWSGENGSAEQAPSAAKVVQPPSIAFYPLHGLYESTDDVLRQQLIKIKSLGIGVLVVTWTPKFNRTQFQQLLTEAERLNLQIIVEFDDYHNRTVYSLSNDLNYFFDECWHHGGFYKVFTISTATYMPMFYVKHFDAIAVHDWNKLLAPNGVLSIRNSKQDAVFIGHIR